MKGKFHWLIALCITLVCFGVVAAWAALPPSGQLSFSQIQGEFGGSNPISISEYYRGGGLVPNIPANTNVPTSGTIKLSDFYGASATVPLLEATLIAGSSGGTLGYQFPSIGSMSPTTTTDGKTVLSLRTEGGTITILTVGGFVSDPGQTGWGTGVDFEGIGLPFVGAASYTYDGGSQQAQWAWGGAVPMTNGMSYMVTILQ